MSQFVDGLKTKVNDQPRDAETARTIVILAARSEGRLPDNEDVIYFEIPEALGRIQSLSAEVHIYIFATRPTTPQHGLASLGTARKSLWCRTLGLEDEQGGIELRADWQIVDRTDPRLEPTSKPFRPRASPGMQQVRVKVRGSVFGDFEYLFHEEKPKWEPVLESEGHLAAPERDREFLSSLKIIPAEDKDWFRVKALRPAEASGSEGYKIALRDTSPESGSFILFSRRRRNRDAKQTG